MKRSLLLISLTLLFGVVCMADEKEYGLLMQFRGREVTGLCIMSTSENGDVVGTVVNEMGVKAFDFTHTQGKTKVLNVFGPMNKWYIRKVLKADFAFIIPNISRGENIVKKHRSMTVLSNDDILVKNEKYKISYTFTPQNNGQ